MGIFANLMYPKKSEDQYWVSLRSPELKLKDQLEARFLESYQWEESANMPSAALLRQTDSLNIIVESEGKVTRVRKFIRGCLLVLLVQRSNLVALRKI